ncbi:MAG: hypothetical protein J4F28_02210 [Nitrosopumilaceae archaeon]|nr:hypothetical protein [Nitrosopumilaceae archaeon]
MPANRPSKLLLEIAPVWAKDIYRDDLPDKRIGQLESKEDCLIGESYGFDAGYGVDTIDPTMSSEFCKTCNNYGYKIWDHALRGGLREDMGRARRAAEAFTRHFDRVHRKKKGAAS